MAPLPSSATDIPLGSLLPPSVWNNNSPYPVQGDLATLLQTIRVTNFSAQPPPDPNVEVTVEFVGHIDLSISRLSNFGLVIGKLDKPVGDPGAATQNGFELRYEYGDFPQKLTLTSIRTQDGILALLKLPDLLRAEGTGEAAVIEIKTTDGPVLADTAGNLLLPSLALGPTAIGDTGIVLSASEVTIDLHATESPEEAGDSDGSFQGVLLGEVTVDLPPSFGGVDGIQATDFIIGEGGVTGRIEANLSGADLEIGGAAATLDSICVQITDNVPELCGATGRLELPADYFTCADGTTFPTPDFVLDDGAYSAIIDLKDPALSDSCKKINFGGGGSYLELGGDAIATYDCQTEEKTGSVVPARYLRLTVQTDPDFQITLAGSADSQVPTATAPIGVLHLDPDKLRPKKDDARGIVMPESVVIGANGVCLGCGGGGVKAPPMEIGGSGVAVCADDLAIDLSETEKGWPDGSPLDAVNADGDWVGLYAGEVVVTVPFETDGTSSDPEPLRFIAEDMAIGSGGVTGQFTAQGIQDTPVEFGGFDVKLQSVSLDFVRNTPTGGGAQGELLAPFIDHPLDLGFSLDGQGDWLASIQSADGIPVNKTFTPIELNMVLKGIDFGKQDGETVLELDADLQVKTAAFDTGKIALDDLRIQGNGDISLDGGWYAFDQPKVVPIGPFPYELSRIGFGNRDDGRRWLALGGVFQLQDVLPIDVDLHDLTVSWEPGTPDAPTFDQAKLEIPAIGLAMEIPDVLTLEGTLRWCDEQRCPADDVAEGRWFEADVDIQLVSPPMSLGGRLVVGKAEDGDGPFNFWFAKVKADLPAGIAIPGTGASIFAFSGGFGKFVDITPITGNVTPRRKSFVFAAGVDFGTTHDNGFTLSSDVELVVRIPGPLIWLNGKAWILTHRAQRDDPLATIDIVYDGDARTFLIALAAQYQGRKGEGTIVDARGNFEVLLGPEDWHLYLGTRADPITAQVFKDYVKLGAEAYLMFGSDVFENEPRGGFVVGAAIRIEARGPAKKSPVGYEFTLGAGGELALQMQPKQVGVMIFLEGRVAVFVGPINLGLGLEAWLKGQLPSPFSLSAGVRVEVSLPWPLKDVGFDVSVSWTKPSPPPVPPRPIDRIVFESEATGRTVVVPCSGPVDEKVPLDSIGKVTFNRRADCRDSAGVRPCSDDAVAQAAAEDYFRDTVGNCHFKTVFTDWAVSPTDGSGDLGVKGGWGGRLGEEETGPAVDRRYQTFTFKPFRYAFEECPGSSSPDVTTNRDQADLCRPVTTENARICRVLPALKACGGACGDQIRTVRHTVGDKDEFHPGDPTDDTKPADGFTGCPFANVATPLDSVQRNRCRSWHHAYELPAGACVRGARLKLKWRLTDDTQCRECTNLPGSPRRLTEAISFANGALGQIDFGRCQNPFAEVMFGDCPVPPEGVATLDLSAFPGVLERLDGTPLSVGLTDDVGVDWATLEIDYTLRDPLDHQLIELNSDPSRLFVNRDGELLPAGTCDQPAMPDGGSCAPLCKTGGNGTDDGPRLHPIFCTDPDGGDGRVVSGYAVDDAGGLWTIDGGDAEPAGNCRPLTDGDASDGGTSDGHDCPTCQPVLDEQLEPSEPVICSLDDGTVAVPAGDELVTTLECSDGNGGDDSEDGGSGAPFCPQRSYQLEVGAEVRATGGSCGAGPLSQSCNITYTVEEPPPHLDPYIQWTSPPLASRPVYRDNDLVVQFSTDALCELFSCCGDLSPLTLELRDADAREATDRVPGRVLRQGCNALTDNVASLLGQDDDFLVFDPAVTLEPEVRYFLDLPNPANAEDPYFQTSFTTSRFADFNEATADARAYFSGRRVVIETPEALDWLHTTATFAGRRIDSRRISEDQDPVHVFLLDQPGDPTPVLGRPVQLRYHSVPHGFCGCFRDDDCPGGGTCADGVCAGGFTCDADSECAGGSCRVDGPVVRRNGGAVDESVDIELEAMP